MLKAAKLVWPWIRLPGFGVVVSGAGFHEQTGPGCKMVHHRDAKMVSPMDEAACLGRRL